MNINSHSALVQLRLQVIVNKEVDIYVALHPTYEPYREDLKGEVFLTVLRHLPTGKPDTYLKKAASNSLFRAIRDINSPTRHSPIKMLNSRYEDEADEQDEDTDADDATSKCALEACDETSRSPREIVEGNELMRKINKLLMEVDSVTRSLVSDRIEGIPIRESADKVGIPKSTAAERLNAFKESLKALL